MSKRVDELVVDLLMADVSITLDREQLRVNAPKGVIDAALRERLAAAKPALVEHIRSRAATTADVLVAPLSYAQERLWLLAQIQGNFAAYHLCGALRFDGDLDVDALRRSLAEIVRRHGSCRTTFAVENQVPVQRVHADCSLPLTVTDLRDLPEAERMHRVVALARAEAERAFDLEAGPLWRGLLIQVSSQVHVLMATCHHIVSDGWSMAVFVRELGALYSAFHAGDASPLPALPMQYAEFATWQRRQLDGDASRRQLDYWKGRLTPPPPPLSLPGDRPRPAQLSHAGGTATLALTPSLSRAVRELAQAEQVTNFVLLLTIFKVLLHKLSGQTDIAVGTPVANRGRLVLEPLVGLFANTLVIRTSMSDRPGFRELVRRVRQSVVDAYECQDIPFAKVVAELQPPRELNRNPLFDVMFVHRHADETALRLPGLTTTPLDIGGSAGAKFDLSLGVTESENGFVLDCEYSKDLFERATVDRFLSRFSALVESIVAAPASGIDDLRTLPTSEIELLGVFARGVGEEVAEAVPSAGAAHPFSLLLQKLDENAERFPDAVAVSFEGSSLTYGELDRRSNRLARRLRNIGVERGDRIAIGLERSLDLVVALIGVQKSGGGYVPLDPEFPAGRLAYMLQDSGARVLITTAEAGVSAVAPPAVAVLDLDAQRGELEGLSPDRIATSGAPIDLAYVIYTSGSTGRPKGVAVSHGALSAFLAAMMREPGLQRCDVLAAVTTVSFDIAALELYLPLIAGGRVELLSRDVATDGTALAQALDACGATVLQGTPSTWRMLVESQRWPDRLSRALCGGESLTSELAGELTSRVAEVWNLYGPTETTVWSTAWRVEPGAGTITVGKPIAGTRVYVLDDARRHTGIGVPGEIWIGGAGVALGYHDRPELTAERFLDDPFGSGPTSRMYRTGDLGRWDDQGRLHHLGRIDQQVKVRGHRIELGEIESVLADHPAIGEAVAAAVEASPGELRLVAYLKFVAGEDLTNSEVRAYLRDRLPSHMVPALYVPMDRFPLTLNGKVDRKALPSPFQGAGIRVQGSTSLNTESEELVGRLWMEVLKTGQIGAEDNFFELGGHSLLALRVAREIERLTGHRQDPRALFFQNLRQIAAGIDASTRHGD